MRQILPLEPCRDNAGPQPVVLSPRLRQEAVEPMPASSWLEIDLERLDHNLRVLRGLLAVGRPRPAGICAVVKADAYGLGLVPCALRLARRGVDMLAVFSPEEARRLTAAGITTPLLLLSPLRQIERTSPLYRPAVTGRLHLSVHDLPQLDQLHHAARLLGCRLPVHLYLDTGMSRSGLDEADLEAALARLPDRGHLRLAGLYTHLADAESNPEFTRDQLGRLDQVLARWRHRLPADLIIHAASTAAALHHPGPHRDMVRFGLGLYGYAPTAPGAAKGATGGLPASALTSDPGIGSKLPVAPSAAMLRPVLRWRSRVNHLRRYPAGSPVGYGSTCRLQRESVLGVVPVGYADGYPLQLSNQAVVALPERTGPQGRPAVAPVLGRVNMDQIVVDLTETPAPEVGMLVELYSDDPDSPCALPRLAQLAGSHCYEMLTRISARVPRRYLGKPNDE